MEDAARKMHIFQPTLPARGATRKAARLAARPHGISTHAPRTGSDAPGRMEDPMIYKFQPTLPARGATGGRIPTLYAQPISTHAPRTGSDRPGG